MASSKLISQSCFHLHTNLVSPQRLHCRINVCKPLQCSTKLEFESETVVRRSGNYKPTIWDNDFVQSLHSDYTEEVYTRRLEKLKEKVRDLINNVNKPLDQLELIDTIQRLGLDYHFGNLINDKLCEIYNRGDDLWKKGDLYSTSLEFRLLRQHGFPVPEEGFYIFLDRSGSFRSCFGDDVKAMVSLYEASHYSLEGENIIDEAWKFSTENLKIKLNEGIDTFLAMQVRHALEIPVHWRASRLEARWFIDVYERRKDVNPILLEFAKLDFNIVQAMYMEELKEMSRWWKNYGLGEKLRFARNRLVASYFWTTVIDDIYDVYGTLDELQLFTDAVDRWDLKAMKPLPEYMKICFLALYNTVNDMAYDILKEQGLDVIQNLKNSWVGLLRSYMVEAKWYHNGHRPTLQEYMNNGWISITGPIIAIQTYLFTANPIASTELQYIENYPDILYYSSMIFRFQDDLGTSTEELKRGDVMKSIQCIMKENGVSEEVAREIVRDKMRELWKKVNECRGSETRLSKKSVGFMLNLVRMSHCLYHNGDGHGGQDVGTLDLISSQLFRPIPL